MVSTTATCRRNISLTLTKNTTDTYDIPYSENFSAAVVQVLSGNAGDTYDLLASFTPAVAGTLFRVGENIAGTVPAHWQLTGQGVLFYTKGLAIPLVLSYAIGAVSDAVLQIRLYNDVYQGTKTRSL